MALPVHWRGVEGVEGVEGALESPLLVVPSLLAGRRREPGISGIWPGNCPIQRENEGGVGGGGLGRNCHRPKGGRAQYVMTVSAEAGSESCCVVARCRSG